jgi:ACR3 family arsenite transporter
MPLAAHVRPIEVDRVRTGENGGRDPNNVAASHPAPAAALSTFDRYLWLWVALCMVTGGLVGYYLPEMAETLRRAEVQGISVPLALLLWLMIFPMLLKVDIASLTSVGRMPGPLLLTSFINFAIQPFLMYGLAVTFFRGVYAGFLTPAEQVQYVAGSVLLGAGPCTAMVLVWSLLVDGHAGYTILQVTLNDILMLVLYTPTVGVLIGAQDLPPPYVTVAISVGLFVGAPLLLAATVRSFLLRYRGPQALSRVQEAFRPLTMAGLLATLVLIFIFQGTVIGTVPAHIAAIALPLSIQTVAIWVLSYALGSGVFALPHAFLAPASLIATSNFFELAVAVAIAVYGPASGAVLATSVGVLTEVPLMLMLVAVCNRLRPRVDARSRACVWKSAWLRALCAPPVALEAASRVAFAPAARVGGDNAAAGAADPEAPAPVATGADDVHTKWKLSSG